MPKFMIERELPAAGKMGPAALKDISVKSSNVLREQGAGIVWQQSYVTDDKIYCVYIAENERLVREHAQKGGFPANVITRVHAVIDPATAE